MLTEQEKKAWQQQVITEHEELRALIKGLSNFLDQPRPRVGAEGFHTWAAHLSQSLVKLHDKLFRHFRSEVQGGMFDDLKDKFPRATAKIDRLLEEHPTILRDIRELMEATLTYAQGEIPPDPRLRQRTTALLRRMARHEERETDLIQRLTMRDIGSVD